MQHPFRGILPAESNKPTSDQINRRAALGVIAGITAAATTPAWADDSAAPKEAEEGPSGKTLYFVVPAELEKFKQPNRQALGVWGPFKSRWSDKHPLQDKQGFLSWSTADEAKKIESSPEVKEVILFDAKCVMTFGKPGETLTVFLSPNSWPNVKQEQVGEYVSIQSLSKSWSGLPGVRKTKLNEKQQAVIVTFAGEAPEATIAEIRGHAQVHLLSWRGAGVPAVDPPRPTTLALGEEGGPRPTTLAIGEEGGPTTEAIGEEGGPRPSTRRLGEEGGGRPSTKALGEEGGGVTTQAVGEEGGRATTLALGEEGGVAR